MENGEGIATDSDESEPEEDKRPIKIRIAIFFDGTLNNRINIEEREKDSEIYREFREEDEPNSYDNGRTNIAIMEPHLLESSEGYDYCMKCYVEGQGTLNLKKDSLRGYALGGGESGVQDRAGLGIKRAIDLIKSIKGINAEDKYIKKLTFDVFGFSRGAATARYAIHLFFNGRIGYIDQFTGEILYDIEPANIQMQNLGYDIQPNSVKVCFAGLFDTVLSYYGSQYFPFSSNVLQQRAVARADRALHLAAADEHRKDFPLHNIKSALEKGGEEYYLPGVHSDVGGSYNKASELDIEKEKDESKRVYMLPSDENLMILRGFRPDLEQDRHYLIGQGWFKKDEIWLEPREIKPMGRATHHQYANSSLHVSRKNISSAYCNIPLKIMAEYASKSEVKLQWSPKLEIRANKILSLEPDLQKLEGIIRNYIAGAKESRAEDWIGDEASLNSAEMKKIRYRHFHFSASKPSAGYKPRIVHDKATKTLRRKRYIYDA